MTDAETVFNTHSEMADAPPVACWEAFIDRARWMDTFGGRMLVSGIDGMPGAIAEVRMAVEGTPVRREEILLCDPARRLVVRITAAGTAMAAHADFRFDPVGEGCRIEASIHSWMPGSTDKDRARMRAMTQEKIATDFGRLRDVLSGAR
ncbi:MAG TPA: SRPBCC family protein [Sphingomonas sp.]|nr:SRPBCC family protein [Sphingomonas sp.]